MTLAKDLIAHLVYGLTTAAVFGRLLPSRARSGMRVAAPLESCPSGIDTSPTLIATLKASGVHRIYGLPGDSLNGFTDAHPPRRRRSAGSTSGTRKPRAFAAAGEAAITGELAVCAASCGPGNLHLINGLFDANAAGYPCWRSRPISPARRSAAGYFQETHPQELFRECSVYVELVSVPEQLPRVLEIAMRAAIERRGVAVVVIPGEIFLHRPNPPASSGRRADNADRPPRERLAATRPRSSTGAGGSRSWPARGARAPTRAHRDRRTAQGTGRARDARQGIRRVRQPLRRRNDWAAGLFVRLSGDGALRRASHARHRLPVPCLLPRGRRVVQVDIRGENIGRRIPVDVPLVGTVKETVSALLPHLATPATTSTSTA